MTDPPIRENSPDLTDSQVLSAIVVASPQDMAGVLLTLKCPECQGVAVVKKYQSYRRVPHMYSGVDLICNKGHSVPSMFFRLEWLKGGT
jgi:hypothetical protein